MAGHVRVPSQDTAQEVPLRRPAYIDSSGVSAGLPVWRQQVNVFLSAKVGLRCAKAALQTFEVRPLFFFCTVPWGQMGFRFS